MPKTRLQLSRLREKFDFLTEELEIAQDEAKAILAEDIEKPDTSTRALQALSELNKTVSEFDDVCEQIAEHEDQDNVGVSKNLTEASKIIHNCRILAKGLRTRPQHTSREKSTSQAKIKQEQEAQNQQEESSTVQSQVGPVQDTTVQSSHGNIQASSDSIRTISGQTPTLQNSNSTVQDPVVPTVVPGQASMNVRTVNLPKLKLPIFSGDVLRWAEFSDMFSASVDTQVILSDVQKFTYLKEHLRDAAAETISGLQLSSANYRIAKDLLYERFGNIQIQINAHHVALMELPVASNKTSSLRKLYDAAERHLRSLSALGEDVEQPFFVSLLTSKLPRHSMATLEMQVAGSPWTPGLLRKTLGRFIMAQESAERLTAPGQKSGCADHPDQRSFSSVSSSRVQSQGHRQTSSVLTAAERNQAIHQVSCAFCKGGHYADQCTRFKTVVERKSAIGPNRCFRCLRRGHSTSACLATKRCFYCGNQFHHSSLCPTKFSSAERLETQSPGSTMAVSHDATMAFTGDDQAVVMQTALVDVPTNSSDHVSTQARILFDTGSSRSFVTERLQERAKLNVVGEDELALATFGSTVRRTLVYPRVELPIRQKNGSVQTILANVIPEITSPIHKMPINLRQHPCLKNLPLADPELLSNNSKRLAVDVLVGLDSYHNIVGSDRLSLDDSFHLLDSTVGFIASGKVACDVQPHVATLSLDTQREAQQLEQQPEQQLQQQYQHQENEQPSQEQQVHQEEKQHKEVSQSPSSSVLMLQESPPSPRQEQRWQTPVSSGNHGDDIGPSLSSSSETPWSSTFIESSSVDDRDRFTARSSSSFLPDNYKSKSPFASSFRTGKTMFGGQYAAYQPLTAKRQHAASPTSQPQDLPAKQTYQPP